MLVLELKINTTVIGRITARRIHPVNGELKHDTLCTYLVDEGGPNEHTTTHRYGAGAKDLAVKLWEYLYVEPIPTSSGDKEKS